MVQTEEMHMALRNQGIVENRNRGPKFGLLVSTAVASMALASCTTAAPQGAVSFANAQSALENGRIDRAISHAEAAVLAEPRNSGFRALLGAAYLESGRFQSAATAFGEAIELGDSDPRTFLSFALASVAVGDNATAVNVLAQNADAIPTCLLYTSPSPRDLSTSRMPSSA